MNNNVTFNNPVKAEIIKKDGTIIDVPLVNNGVVREGFNYLLGTSFRGVAQISAWSIGLIAGEGASTPVLDPTDTMLSHAWTEATTYDEVVRSAWNPIATTVSEISNPTALIFTFNAATQIRGIFVSSSDVKGGTAGTLWATALFNANMDFVDDDILRIIYGVSVS